MFVVSYQILLYTWRYLSLAFLLQGVIDTDTAIDIAFLLLQHLAYLNTHCGPCFGVVLHEKVTKILPVTKGGTVRDTLSHLMKQYNLSFETADIRFAQTLLVSGCTKISKTRFIYVLFSTCSQWILKQLQLNSQTNTLLFASLLTSSKPSSPRRRCLSLQTQTRRCRRSWSRF